MTARPAVPPRPVTWPLLAVPDEHGHLAFPGLDDSVRQMIRVILLTRPGEQLMRPQFGAGLARFVHEPNTVETRRGLRDVIGAALAAWEPRIAVESVTVDEVLDRPTAMSTRTGARAQVSLTMTLGG